MQSLSLLIKPSSARCNLSCDYCFYKRVAGIYPTENLMTAATAGALIENALGAASGRVSFTWQGGEPTLLGLDFYREVVRLENVHARPGQSVENSLQTNGVLITDEWAVFLKENRFLAGISLDGPAEIHDRYRKDAKGQGTYEAVMRGIARLRRHGVPFNILCLLTDANVGDPEGLYRFFRGKGFSHLQFIPCYETDDAGRPFPFSVMAPALLSFYTRLFDLWITDGFYDVSIRMFEDILIYFIDGAKVSCGFSDRCDSYLLVEHNGDVYPCDFFVYPEYRIGNISDSSFSQLAESPARNRFASLKSALPADCVRCEWLSFCRGDCTRFRADRSGGYTGLSTFCGVNRGLLTHIAPFVPEIKQRVAKFRERTPEGGKPLKTVGRNDPCPCGSGLKYKRCCGK
ncbi:MAG: anaerobic sulfatase maturase [Deltaproteobacteria bacterium]|nr:anaerobic sulfatase maturase [Candidatus Zymogenaceae bacterium]